jgi:uncharacterized membrane protein (DUF2068 family)
MGVMLDLIKRIWHYLALIAGAALIGFEVSKPGGITGESWFWLLVGVLIVILATVEIVQRRRPRKITSEDKVPPKQD